MAKLKQTLLQWHNKSNYAPSSDFWGKETKLLQHILPVQDSSVIIVIRLQAGEPEFNF
jgi:hypothetical protein